MPPYCPQPQKASLSAIASKVPEVTIYFWLIKVLCTTVGGTAADFLNTNLGLGLTGTTLVMGQVSSAFWCFSSELPLMYPGFTG
jgi:uncharacterized membrane-anchored protein